MVRLMFGFLLIIVFMSLFNCMNSDDFNTDIESFRLIGTDYQFERLADSIFLYVPHESDVTNLKAEITRCNNKMTIYPTSGTYLDFLTPQKYIIIGADRKEKEVQVTVKVSPWKQILKNEEAPFLRVDGHQLIVFKDKLWLLGGWLGKYDHDKASFKLGNSH